MMRKIIRNNHLNRYLADKQHDKHVKQKNYFNFFNDKKKKKNLLIFLAFFFFDMVYQFLFLKFLST